MLWIVCSIICFLLVHFWRVTVPLGIALLAIGLYDGKQERKQYRGYDPTDFSQEEVQQNVRIMVPANVKDGSGEWPVTVANNATRAYGESTFFVLCTATETVLDGTTNWVLGIKQYPYMLTARMTIPAKSIGTTMFTQASDDMGPHTNLTKCALYTDGITVASAKETIDEKWIQVTPRGAARAQEIGFTWMNIPQGSNASDYQVVW